MNIVNRCLNMTIFARINSINIYMLVLFSFFLIQTYPIKANAQEALTLCTGTDTTTFNPGLLLVPRESTTAWSDDYPVCISDYPGITSATSPGSSYTTSTSCLDLLTSDPVDGSQRIDWSSGEHSIFSWNAEDVVIVNAAGQQITIVNATVVEGLYTGHPLVETIVAPELGLLSCLSEPGLTETTGAITLAILPII